MVLRLISLGLICGQFVFAAANVTPKVKSISVQIAQFGSSSESPKCAHQLWRAMPGNDRNKTIETSNINLQCRSQFLRTQCSFIAPLSIVDRTRDDFATVSVPGDEASYILDQFNPDLLPIHFKNNECFNFSADKTSQSINFQIANQVYFDAQHSDDPLKFGALIIAFGLNDQETSAKFTYSKNDIRNWYDSDYSGFQLGINISKETTTYYVGYQVSEDLFPLAANLEGGPFVTKSGDLGVHTAIGFGLSVLLLKANLDILKNETKLSPGVEIMFKFD